METKGKKRWRSTGIFSLGVAVLSCAILLLTLFFPTQENGKFALKSGEGKEINFELSYAMPIEFSVKIDGSAKATFSLIDKEGNKVWETQKPTNRTKFTGELAHGKYKFKCKRKIVTNEPIKVNVSFSLKKYYLKPFMLPTLIIGAILVALATTHTFISTRKKEK